MLLEKYSTDGTPLEKLKPASEKKVRVQCELCKKERLVNWHNYQLGQDRKNHNGETLCRKCTTIANGSKRRGRPSWNKGNKIPFSERKGKSYISTDGYKMVFDCQFDRSHHSQWANYRKEHCVIMEKHIGRKLVKGDVIHHIDGDKLNNNIDNLWLTNHSGHRIAHTSIQIIGYQLFKNGILEFDRDSGVYSFCPEWTEKLNQLLVK